MRFSTDSLTSPRQMLQLMVAKQIKQTYVVPGEVRYYTAVALTDAVPLSAERYSRLYGHDSSSTLWSSTVAEVTEGWSGVQDRFIVKAMIIADQIGDPLDSTENPHHMLPIPCAATTAETTSEDMGKIMMYTTFVSIEDFTLLNGSNIRINDKILVGLSVGADGYQELGRGTLEAFISRGEEQESEELAGCATPLAMTFANHGEVTQRRTARTTSRSGTSAARGPDGPNPPLPGPGLGAAPYEEGSIPMIRSWTAHISTGGSNHYKDDYEFGSGRCPGGLTGFYKTLPRYNTTFTKYNESDITTVFENAGSTYPLYVRLTAYVFMWGKEQPPRSGVFTFPNNNVAGLQSDGGQQRGIGLSDVDFQTCWRDAETYRGFLGWYTIDRAIAAFVKSINGRYQSTSKWRSRHPPTNSTADAFATAAADNYYQGYNVIASDTELASIKENGQFTRNGVTYTRDYDSTKSSFARKFNDFKTAYPDLFT